MTAEEKLKKLDKKRWISIIQIHEEALARRLKEVREDVPFADEKTLNIMFTE